MTAALCASTCPRGASRDPPPSRFLPYKLASVLLQYPTMALFDGLGHLAEAASRGSESQPSWPFGKFLEWLSRTSPGRSRHALRGGDL